MRIFVATLSLLVAASAASAWTGCSSDPAGESGSQNATEATCNIFIVKDQKSVSLADFVAGNDDPAHAAELKAFRQADPIVQKLLLRGCPGTYKDMQAKLAPDNCKLETRIVSERSAETKKNDVSRALASRTCNGTPDMFFLLDPVDTRTKAEAPAVGAGDPVPGAVPDAVEMIGNVAGVFSYYAHEPKTTSDATLTWKFYGTSADFVSNDYDCDVTKFSGACQSKFAQDPGNGHGVDGNKSGVRCASCHPGGGLVQKELHFPWTNWMRPAPEYLSANASTLGTFQSGESFEGVSTSLNRQWAQKRVAILQKKSVKDLLRPLFCTMDINLQTRGSVTADLLLDPVFAPGMSSQIAPFGPNYKDVIAANSQQIGGKGMESFKDTADIFIYPERSQLDIDYVNAVKTVVGEDLVRDILFVDFTRPVFSPTRCGLLSLTEGLKNPQTARADILKNVQANQTNAAALEFLNALNGTGTGPARHDHEIDAYQKACAARSGKPDFTEEVVKYASHLRRVARLPRVVLVAEEDPDRTGGDFGIIEFDETLPKDKFDLLPLSQPAFSKDTCALQNF